MKTLIYSDLHLEHRKKMPFYPKDEMGDLLILAGDIINFNDTKPLDEFLKHWTKLVIYVAGNHEYYGCKSIFEAQKGFFEYTKSNKKNIIFLENDSIAIDDVEIFGGTMWSCFDNSNPLAMLNAEKGINDFKKINYEIDTKLKAKHLVNFNLEFKNDFSKWNCESRAKTKVVVSHFAPVENPNSQFKGDALQPYFVSCNMQKVIENHQPNYWIHGHTHECYDLTIGKTKVVSNQLGYSTNKEFNINKTINL